MSLYFSPGLGNCSQQISSMHQLYVSRDLSADKSRLIQNFDGTYFVAPRAPAYVFGEKFLKPLLDTSGFLISKSYELIRYSLPQIDNAVSRALNFIPGTYAETKVDLTDESLNPSNALVRFNPVDRGAAIVWHSLGINPNAYGDFVESLMPEQKLNVLHDKEFQDNFLRVQNMMTNLSHFIANNGAKFFEFKDGIQKSCKDILYIDSTLSKMLKDLKDKGTKSIYNYSSKNLIILTFPKFSGEGNILREGMITRNRNILPPLIGEEGFDKIKMICSENPIEVSLLENLIQRAALLKALNLDGVGDFTFDEFKALFSTSIVNHLESLVDKLKNGIDSGEESIEEIITIIANAFLSHHENEIRQKIHLLYEKHVEMCDGNKDFEIVVRETEGGLVTYWDVISLGYLFNERVFRFRVGGQYHFNDEL